MGSEFDESQFNEASRALQAPLASSVASQLSPPARLSVPSVLVQVPTRAPVGDLFSRMDRNHDSVLSQSEFNEAQFTAARRALHGSRGSSRYTITAQSAQVAQAPHAVAQIPTGLQSPITQGRTHWVAHQRRY